jgi:5-formyltetrahydrofolate cyclo-ligase
MKKTELRKLIKSNRKIISKEDIHRISDVIIQHLLGEFDWKDRLVNLFLPIQKHNEIDLNPLKAKIEAIGGQVCINRSDFETFELTPILWDEKLIVEENNFGIPEPVHGKKLNLEDIDIVLVPLLAYTREGHRLGYGKGFYDRFLSKTAVDCIHIGICHNGEAHQIDDIGEKDIALKYLVSPEGLQTFS